MKKALFLLNLLSLSALSLMAQQTATIHGHVAASDGVNLPGVVINLTSDRLQGTRSSVSREDGSFLFKLLPPGTYEITATMVGMATTKETVFVGLGQTVRPRLTMQTEAIEETMLVTAEAKDSVVDTNEVITNISSEKLEELPAGRTITSAVYLSPGVTNDGPNGALQISGAQSFENLFLVNGVVVNENLRGQPHSAYIEDAVQEVSVLTGAISAEYGQFTGGVVNTITKSGGNEYEGSFRVSLDNDAWASDRPLQTAEYNDKVNHVETLTFGGPIMKDRLWFFVAARRQRDESQSFISSATALTSYQIRTLNRYSGYTIDEDQPVPGDHYWPYKLEDDRIEVKLTGQIATDHTIIASYLYRGTDEFNDTQFGVLSQSAMDDFRSLPNTLASLTYRGILSPELTLEALYSQKEFTFENSGGDDPNLFTGTPIRARNNGDRNIGAPIFSGLEDEERDNETISAKLSYYLTTDRFGSHDIVFGMSELSETRYANNRQSATDWILYSSYARFENLDAPFPTAIPIFAPDRSSLLTYWPIIESSIGSDFTSQAAFINDSWVLNDKWRFNIGVRYDKNDTKAQDGTLLSDSSMISPRLAVAYDIFGDGRHNVMASFGRYVAKLANAAEDVSVGGNPAIVVWPYLGDNPTEDIAEVFSWFEQFYGVNVEDGQDAIFQSGALAFAQQVTIPGGTTVLPEPLDSPIADEYTLGYSTRLGNRGFLRLDYVHREYDKFYVDRVDTTTGKVEVPGTWQYDSNGNPIPGTGDLADLTVLDNSDGEYIREYDAVMTQFQYQFEDTWGIGANYTWSQLRGNIVGETSGSGPIASGALTTYPEYKGYPNYYPLQYLPGDLRHKLDLWIQRDLPTAMGDFNFSLLYKFQSGGKYGYGANWTVDDRSDDRSYEAFGFQDPSVYGYETPPTSIFYQITAPDAFKYADFTRFDLAINWALQFKRMEFFVQFEVYNLLNQERYLGENPRYTYETEGFAGFNVFTEEPVEGVNYIISSDGTQRTSAGYQAPRSFRMDVGFRF
jgi:hypothetical protein